MSLRHLIPTGTLAFEHALFHYDHGSPFDYLLSILHADHAVELFLKARAARFDDVEMVNRTGKSLSFWQALRACTDRGVKIPEAAKLGTFHDLRNPIQHIGEVDEETATSLLGTVALPFLERFARAELNVDIERTFSPESLRTLERIRSTDKTPLDRLIHKLAQGHPEMAEGLRVAAELVDGGEPGGGLVAARELEKYLKFRTEGSSADQRQATIGWLAKLMVEHGLVERAEAQRLRSIADMRNQLAHPTRQSGEDMRRLASVLVTDVVEFLAQMKE